MKRYPQVIESCRCDSLTGDVFADLIQQRRILIRGLESQDRPKQHSRVKQLNAMNIERRKECNKHDIISNNTIDAVATVPRNEFSMSADGEMPRLDPHQVIKRKFQYQSTLGANLKWLGEELVAPFQGNGCFSSSFFIIFFEGLLWCTLVFRAAWPWCTGRSPAWCLSDGKIPSDVAVDSLIL